MTLLRRPRRLRRYGLTRPLVILRTSLRRKKRSKVDREKRSWADGFQSCEAARNRQRTAAGGRVLCLVGSRARVDENVLVAERMLFPRHHFAVPLVPATGFGLPLLAVLDFSGDALGKRDLLL